MALSVASLLSAAAARLVQLEEQQQQQQGDGEVTAASVTTPWRGSLQLAVQTSQEEDVFYGHGRLERRPSSWSICSSANESPVASCAPSCPSSPRCHGSSDWSSMLQQQRTAVNAKAADDNDVVLAYVRQKLAGLNKHRAAVPDINLGLFTIADAVSSSSSAASSWDGSTAGSTPNTPLTSVRPTRCLFFRPFEGNPEAPPVEPVAAMQPSGGMKRRCSSQDLHEMDVDVPVRRRGAICLEGPNEYMKQAAQYHMERLKRQRVVQ